MGGGELTSAARRTFPPIEHVDTLVRVHTLSEIEDAIRASWDLDTADETNEWSPDNPSCGQCDVTSLVVHDIFGGELLLADVTRNGEHVEWHMWNRLPGGMELDLTRDQFRNSEVIGKPSVRPRRAEIANPEHPRYHRYEAYLVLARRVEERLSGTRTDLDAVAVDGLA